MIVKEGSQREMQLSGPEDEGRKSKVIKASSLKKMKITIKWKSRKKCIPADTLILAIKAWVRLLASKTEKQ